MQEHPKKHSISLSWKSCARIGVVAFLVILAATWWQPLLNLIGRMLNAAAPLFIGFVIAYMVNILMTLYEKHYFAKHQEDWSWVRKTRRGVCIVLALATVIGVIILILQLVIPQLVSAVKVITNKLPGVLTQLSKNPLVIKFVPESIQESMRELDYEALIKGIIDFLTNGASPPENLTNLTGVVGSLTSTFMTGFMGFIFSIYILSGKEKLHTQFKRLFRSYLSSDLADKCVPVIKVADTCFHNFIVGQIVEAIIIGSLCALGMTILRLPYAAMIGAVVGVTALIPILGCYLGAGVGALMCLSVSIFTAVEFLIFIFLLQQFEDNLIYPRVVGTSLGLPGIWVLASVAVGGGIGGLPGMIFAVPVAATIYQLLRLDVGRRERKEGRCLNAEDVIHKLKQEKEEEEQEEREEPEEAGRAKEEPEEAGRAKEEQG